MDLFTYLCPADNGFITEIKAELLRRVQPVPPQVPVEHLLFNEEGLCYLRKDISLENSSVGMGVSVGYPLIPINCTSSSTLWLITLGSFSDLALVLLSTIFTAHRGVQSHLGQYQGICVL